MRRLRPDHRAFDERPSEAGILIRSESQPMPNGPDVVNGVRIADTFAEAFSMRAARVIITAASKRWAHQAATNMTGFATSVIGCKC
jgi:hypothetical protein